MYERLDRGVRKLLEVVALGVATQRVPLDGVLATLKVHIGHLGDTAGGGPAERPELAHESAGTCRVADQDEAEEGLVVPADAGGEGGLTGRVGVEVAPRPHRRNGFVQGKAVLG